MSAFIEQFHFLRPWWLAALLLVPLLLWVWRRHAQRVDPWRRICDAQLLTHLRQESTGSLRAGATLWLIGTSLMLTIFALAGPAFRFVPEPLVRMQAPLIIAVDLSEQVRASDLKPDRMTRVRFKLANLLAQRHEGQAALIGYAGDAFTVAPLTDDAASLADLAASLSPDIMPLRGQRTDRAITLAMQLLKDAGETQGDLLLLTDSSDARANAAAQRALGEGLTVSVLGVGTRQGAPIPKSSGGFVLDRSGAILIPRLEADSLAALARAGGGKYTGLAFDDADLRYLGVTDARSGSAEHVDAEERAGKVWRDEGPWLLLGLLPLAALMFRRGGLAAVVLVLLLPTAPAQAFEWSSLWQRPDQRAWDALHDGDAGTARELADDPAILGAAAYREGDYPDAIEQFSINNDATGHYNRGNALAKAERYEEAIAAYDDALVLQPDFPDATSNRQAVEDWLRKQPPPEQQQGDSSDESGDEGEGSPSESDEDSNPQPDEDPSDPSTGGNEEGQFEPSDADESDAGDEQEADEPPELEAEQHDEAGSNGADEPEPAPAEDQPDQYAEEMQQALDQAEADDKAEERVPISTEEAEHQQAMEQLLQRVPDDPGGLLRRKFQLEFQRRQQEGGRR